MNEDTSRERLAREGAAGWFIFDAQVDKFVAGPTREDATPGVYLRIEGHLVLDDGATQETFTFLMKPTYAMWLAAQLMAASVPESEDELQ